MFRNSISQTTPPLVLLLLDTFQTFKDTPVFILSESQQASDTSLLNITLN